MQKGFSMTIVQTITTYTTAFFLFGGLCYGNEQTIRITPMGNASIEYGQIVKGYDKSTGDISNVWMEKVFLGFGMQAIFSPVDTLRGAAEIKMFNEFPRTVVLGATRRQYHYPYIREAQYIRSIFQKDAFSLYAGAGYFPYKYDENARNLGEYLFRSTAYPQTLTTEFDFPFARLFGAYGRGSSSFSLFSIPSKLSADLLLTSNQEWMAVHDVNVSLLMAWNIAKTVEIGGGASFCSILSADPNATSPKSENTLYVDTIDGKPDTLNYTFAGTKLMGRASIDLKRFFTNDNTGVILGSQDLRLYSEASVLGVKNYPAALKSPVWYMSILERIPVMVGFSFPTFKLLDVLSLEGEWWGNRYPNTMEGIVIDGVPLPFREGVTEIDSTKYKGDNWKWSVYGKKAIGSHFQIAFQAASDHMRTFALDWLRQDWEESMRSPKKWYYVIKAGVVF